MVDPLLDETALVPAIAAGIALGILAALAVSARRTARRRAERATVDRIILRRLSLALDAAEAGAWEWRLGMPSLRASGFARLLGTADDDAVTVETWTAAVHPDDREAFLASFASAIDRGAPWSSLHRIVRPDGGVRWLDARGEPMRDADGTVVGMLGISVDATARQRRQERAREAARVAHLVSEAAAALTALADEALIVAEAVERAPGIFGCDEAAYWSRAQGGLVLTGRVPLPPAGERTTAEALLRHAGATDPASGTVVQAAPIPGSASARSLVIPVTVAGEPEGFIALGWESVDPVDAHELPDAAWLAALDRFAANIAIALVVARRQHAAEERDRLARRLQAGLMPTVGSSGLGPDALTVQTVYQAGEERLMLGGDFLDVMRHDDGGVSFVLGDVCGHGPAEAALGTILRSAWIGRAADGERDPERWAAVLHAVLLARREHESTFVTLVTGTIDPAASRLTLVVAGHPPPLLAAHGTVRTADEGAGPALGLGSAFAARAAEHALPPAFALLAVTDGLYEGFDATGARLGYDGLLDLLARFPLHDPHALRRLVSSVESLNGGRLADDAAAILVSRP